MPPTLLFLALLTTQLLAAPVYYARWSPTPITENGITKYIGTINITGTVVTVKYYASQPIAGIDTGAGTPNYWVHPTSTKPSPYLSGYVSNLPPASQIIRITHAQMNYFEFSKAVEGVAVAIVSENANSYVFDRDFKVYSYGDDKTTAPGYWGVGTLVRKVTPYGKFSCEGTGEPHGVIGLEGSFENLFFQSMNEEFWNGFNVGVFGLAPKSCPYAVVEVTPNATTGKCSPPPLHCVKLLNAVPTTSQTVSTCQVQNSGAALLSLSSAGQKVYLTGRADGTTSPYFDELAVLKVFTPCKKVNGRNLVAWQNDCRDTAFESISIPTSQNGNIVDITALFNNEIGEFSISLQVLNKYTPYSNADTYVCTGSGITPTGTSIVAELSEISSAVYPGAGAGLSVAEIVAICVGAVVGTLLIIAGIGFVGYRVASKSAPKSELNEKFVLY